MLETLLVVLLVIALIVVVSVIYRASSHPTSPMTPGLPANARVVFTDHAQQRMRERGILENQVTELLRQPQRSQDDATQGSVRLERDFDGRTLKVWVNPPWPPTQEAVIRTTAWTAVETLTVPREAVGRVKGTGGAVVRQIQLETATWINVSSDGKVIIKGDSLDAIKRARTKVEALALVSKLSVGTVATARVTRILPWGAAIALTTGEQGTIHVSRLRPLAGGKRVAEVTDVVSVGQALQVRLEEVSEGRLRFALA